MVAILLALTIASNQTFCPPPLAMLFLNESWLLNENMIFK